MLHKFQKFQKKLKEIGIERKIGGGGFTITTKEVDFTKNDIQITDDEIVAIDNFGVKHKGYMFIKYYYVQRYNSFPKFHIIKCKTIRDFIKEGLFNQRYIFSNSNVVDVIDKGTNEHYNNKVLHCCKYCLNEINTNIKTTEDFYNSLDKEVIDSPNIEVDIFGYVKEWKNISKVVRETKDYTCEKCGLKPANNLDKRFWQVHHINGNKKDNKTSNLKCMCIYCHSMVDENHKNNFNKGSRLIELETFKKKYKN